MTVWVGLSLSMLGCNRPKQPSPVHVLTATSLAPEVRALAAEFQSRSGIEVVVVSGSSNSLVTQMVSGAPADIFISAHPQWIKELAKQGPALTSDRIASNRLLLAAEVGNPSQIKGPEDLLGDKVQRVGIGGPGVPVGDYAREYLKSIDLKDDLRYGGKLIYAPDAATLSTWLARGEIDAAFIFASDRKLNPCEVITVAPSSSHAPIVYRLVMLEREGSLAAAKSFRDFICSDHAQAQFERAGYVEDFPVADRPSGD